MVFAYWTALAAWVMPPTNEGPPLGWRHTCKQVEAKFLWQDAQGNQMQCNTSFAQVAWPLVMFFFYLLYQSTGVKYTFNMGYLMGNFPVKFRQNASDACKQYLQHWHGWMVKVICEHLVRHGCGHYVHDDQDRDSIYIIRPLSWISIRPISWISIRPNNWISIRPLSQIGIRPISRISIRPVGQISIWPISQISIRSISQFGISVESVPDLSVESIPDISIKSVYWPISQISIWPISRTVVAAVNMVASSMNLT